MSETGKEQVGQKFTVGGFYGAKNKRKWIGLERSVENIVKKHKAEKIPDPYQSRILGPSTKWETYFRQQDAFAHARSSTGGLHVFAFESDTFGEQCGQRMFLVASYPVFWHYYSQLSLEKRHHYEVIPEGCVCKLYFDLEYDISSNPDRQGDMMVDFLIKFVCLCLEEEFGLKCTRQNVLDLDASTKAKFSRHLIFLPENTAFSNNIHVGNFVSHCFSQLWTRIKEIGSKSIEHSSNDMELVGDSNGKTICNGNTELVNRAIVSPSKTDIIYCHNCCKSSEFLPCDTCTIKTCSNSTQSLRTNSDNTAKLSVHHTCNTDGNNTLVSKSSEIDSKTTKTNEDGIGSRSEMVEKTRLSKTNEDGSGSRSEMVEKTRLSKTNEDGSGSRSEMVEKTWLSSDADVGDAVVSTYKKILAEFSDQELQMLIVKNKHGDDVLFCDTGVYTKNRNFRLYKSSKLGKNNPLVLSEHNTYTPANNDAADQQIFDDSLVSNIEFTDKLRLLTFGDGTTTSGNSSNGEKHRHKDKCGETMGGYSKSPYPEVDMFITGLISCDGATGVIRHWTYFQQGELLLYEVSHYRYCHNIGRPHRSNNIMYIADLRRGVYYQKCHDPECQGQNFKSQEWPLPHEVLPAHYFDDNTVEDSLEFQTEDEDFLNTTAEMEKQYLHDTEKQYLHDTEKQYLHDTECSGATFEQDDLDDAELSKAAEAIENSFHSE